MAKYIAPLNNINASVNFNIFTCLKVTRTKLFVLCCNCVSAWFVFEGGKNDFATCLSLFYAFVIVLAAYILNGITK